MSSTRHAINWISMLLALVYVVVYLLAPFFQTAYLPLPLNGFRLIDLNALAILPVLLGVVMAFGACLFPPLAAVVTEGITLLLTLAFMLLRNALISSLTLSASNLSVEWAAPVQSEVTTFFTVVPGWGAVVCAVLCVAALVMDIVVNLDAGPDTEDEGGVLNIGEDISSNSNDIGGDIPSNSNDNLFDPPVF